MFNDILRHIQVDCWRFNTTDQSQGLVPDHGKSSCFYCQIFDILLCMTQWPMEPISIWVLSGCQEHLSQKLHVSLYFLQEKLSSELLVWSLQWGVQDMLQEWLNRGIWRVWFNGKCAKNVFEDVHLVLFQFIKGKSVKMFTFVIFQTFPFDSLQLSGSFYQNTWPTLSEDDLS